MIVICIFFRYLHWAKGPLCRVTVNCSIKKKKTKLAIQNICFQTFQVMTDGAGNGYLTVSIMGPRPYTVSETSVTYTGDNMYEVFYEVTKPGYYIINIKWADFDIPGSPYVCHITF